MLAPILRSLARGVFSGKSFSIVAPLLGPLTPGQPGLGVVCGTADLVPSVTGRAGLAAIITGAAALDPTVAGIAELKEC